MTYLTVPIAVADLDSAGRQIKTAIAAGAEMLELRVDYLKNLNPIGVKKLIAGVKSASGQALPVIVTCRDKRQGGAGDYRLKLRIEVLAGAVDAGADFIDLEYENFLPARNRQQIQAALSRSPGAKLILSAHNFEKKFSDIGKLYRDILNSYPAAVAKLVYTANHINDCFEAFDLLHSTGGERIIFCMGTAGLISRIIAKKLGSFVTFASLDENTATAPGQLSVEQLRNLYRFDGINCDTELFGVIGSPVAHSAGPAVHNACFADKGMNKLYLPLLVQGGQPEFDLFLNSVLSRKWLNFRGFSITIPHKQNALDYINQKQGFIEPLAEKIGAVNTLVVGPNDELSAYNTDYAGALDAITSTLDVTGADLNGLDVAVIGAGGVARAIVAGLSDAGAKITIYNRTVKKAERLAGDFDCDFAPLDDLPGLKAKLVINCTSVGMYPNTEATSVPKEYIEKDMVVFDMVYNPAETLLLRQAKDTGAKTIDGLTMFINQAAAQFALFTGRRADKKLMQKYISG